MCEINYQDKVTTILKAYIQKRNECLLLRYELAHPNQVSEQDLMESLALSRPHGTDSAHGTGGISNKTMMIALRYRDTAQTMNSEVLLQINQELNHLETELGRMDYYISLLEEKLQTVIDEHYRKGKAWPQLKAETGLSERTLKNRRDRGVLLLANMYQQVDRAKGGGIREL